MLARARVARVQQRRGAFSAKRTEEKQAGRQDGTQWAENRKEVRPLPKKWPVAAARKRKNAQPYARKKGGSTARRPATIGRIPMKLEQQTDEGGETPLFNAESVNKKINLDPSHPTNEILVITAGDLSYSELPRAPLFSENITFAL